jgi:iron(III) transport system ATP-binding protein
MFGRATLSEPAHTAPQPATSAAGQAGGPPAVRIRNLSKRFRRRNGEVVQAVDDVSLDISTGELVVFLGPSGCGKTTLLRCIAGLESPDSGRIEIGGVCVFDSDERISVPTHRRDISMMFQSYALWPHMTASKNVEYAVTSRHAPRDKVKSRVVQALGQVGVGELAEQYPAQMSGGQQQRIALARSLAVDPKVVLFDEPLSNVDAKVRDRLRAELVLMQHRLRFAGVYVTHDQIEAMQLADRLAVMGTGRIQQIADPQAVYRNPATQYVAQFVGQTNELRGTVTGADERETVVETELGPVAVAAARAPFAVGASVCLIVRPEDVRLETRADSSGRNRWTGTVETAMFSGAYIQYGIRLGDQLIKSWSLAAEPVPEGAGAWVSVSPDTIHVFEGQ